MPTSKNTLAILCTLGVQGLDKELICTQAPKADTSADFWRMVWQEKAALIVSFHLAVPVSPANLGNAVSGDGEGQEEVRPILAQGSRRQGETNHKPRLVSLIKKTYAGLTICNDRMHALGMFRVYQL